MTSSELTLPIGTKVKVLRDSDRNPTFKIVEGKKGKVVGYDSVGRLGIEFFTYIGGHTCRGTGRGGYCRYISQKDVRINNYNYND